MKYRIESFAAASIVGVYSLVFGTGFYPNQIYWLYVALVMLLVEWRMGSVALVLRRGDAASFAVVLYFIIIPLTSAWEMYDGMALTYTKFAIINLLIFLIFFSVFYHVSPRLNIKYMIASVVPIIIMTVYQLVFESDRSRFGSPEILAMYVFPLYGYGHFAILGMSVLMIFVSIKKISVAMLAAGALFYGSLASRLRMTVVMLAVLGSVGVFSMFVPALGEVISITLGRIQNDLIYVFNPGKRSSVDIDTVRAGATIAFASLVIDHWLLGIGYGSFQEWYLNNIGYYEIVDGKSYGLNLHSSYQTWSLEGGIATVLIVAYILYSFFSKIVKMAKSGIFAREVNILRLFMIQILVLALFHQAHDHPLLWGTIGASFGLYARLSKSGTLATS